MEKKEQLLSNNKKTNKLQYFLGAAALSLMLNLWTPAPISAQTKQPIQKEMKKDSLEKKEIVNERSEINKLKKSFKKWPYGSEHFIWMLWGKFVWDHGKTVINGRSLTSAYDYLILDNTMMALLVNLWFTEDNIKFISTKKLPHRQPYKLWYTTYEENKKREVVSDSAYSQIQKKNVAIKKSVVTNYTLYTIDSSKTVDVALGWVKYTRKEGKNRISTFVEIPQLENTGKGTDANNFDLAYETMEYFYEQNKENYDISKRQFSSKTPAALKNYIIANFNKQKILKERKAKGEGIAIVNNDTLLVDNNIYHNAEYLLDIMNKPNNQVFSFGNYQFFRYFTDIYRRDMRFDQVGVNPIWHNAFQNDNDTEKQKDGLIDFLVLHYGTKNYMPTLVPKQMPWYSKLDGLIAYDTRWASKESMNTMVLNWRIIEIDRYEIPADIWLFTLPKDWTVDRMYKIYSTKDQKTFWLFVYCWAQSWNRWWSQGKLLPDKAIELKNKLVTTEDWKIANNTAFWYYKNNKDLYINKLEAHIRWASDFDQKVIPNLIIPVTIKNPNKPKKSKIEYKKLRFLDKKTAMIYPDSLIVGWHITKEYVDKWRSKQNLQDIEINFLGTKVLLDSLPGVLAGNILSPDIIQNNNEGFIEIQQKEKNKEVNKPIAKAVIEVKAVINELYNNHIYNLSDINDNRTVLYEITNDIANLEYKIKAIQESITAKREKKLSKVQTEMGELETQSATGSKRYAELKKQQEAILAAIQDEEQQLFDTKNERAKLYKLQQKYYMTYIEALEYIIKWYDSRIAFLEKQITTATNEMKGLNPNDKIYRFKEKVIEQNQKEILVVEEQKNEFVVKRDAIKKEKQEKQLLILDEKDAQNN